MRTRLLGLLAVLSLFVLMALPASAGFNPGGSDFPISLGSKGQLTDKGRTATVSVSFTCPANETVQVYAQLNQQTGRLRASGDGGTSVACTTGESRTVQVPITARSGVFANGPASAGADANYSIYIPGSEECPDCGSWQYFSAHTSGTVRLSK